MDNRLRLIPFEPYHLSLINCTRPEMKTVPGMIDLDDYGNKLKASGPAFSLFTINDEIIGSGGFGLYWPGVAEGWLMLSDSADRFFFSIHKLVSHSIPTFMNSMKLRRLQIMIPSDSKRAFNWATRLGFISEGLMTKYGPDGSDYYRMARFT